MYRGGSFTTFRCCTCAYLFTCVLIHRRRQRHGGEPTLELLLTVGPFWPSTLFFDNLLSHLIVLNDLITVSLLNMVSGLLLPSRFPALPTSFLHRDNLDVALTHDGRGTVHAHVDRKLLSEALSREPIGICS